VRASDALDADAVRRWIDVCVRDLRALRAEIDDINVYPVADSDTGSNLLHTMTAARDGLDGIDGTHAGEALGAAATAAVRAARGNSGTILSQVLRGMAASAAETPVLTGADLVAALRAADTAATKAVARPVAGTMLSVLHAVCTALGDGEHPDVTDVAVLAAKEAARALADTPRQLAPLAAAGVVDAGGRGLVAVFDALVEVLTGARTTVPTCATDRAGVDGAASPRTWEVMYLLSGVDTDAAAGLRRALSALGDSVTVAEAGAGEYAVHVHCADIGAALEAGLEHGRPHRVRVEPLLTPSPAEPAVPADRAVVAVVHGEELAAFVAEEGTPVLAVPAHAEPREEDLLDLVTATAAGHVTVLAGGVGLTAAAERVTSRPELEGRDVVVVPSASPVQVLAALAVHDPNRRAGSDVVAMAEAAAATRRAEIVVAAEDAITWVGRVAAGDVVGFIDGEVVLIESGETGEATVRAATGVLDRMLAVGGELVTVLTGADAPDGVVDVLTDHLRAERPDVELVCYPGGQTDAVLLMGVE
jgi:DAK2 domain fusion protein YloV